MNTTLTEETICVLNALDRAAAYYRRGLKEIIADCWHDKPNIDKIREHAEQAISAADYELSLLNRELALLTKDSDACRRTES